MPIPLTSLLHQIESGDVVLAAVSIFLCCWVIGAGMRVIAPAFMPSWTGGAARFGGQMGLVLGLEQAYEYTRGQIPHKTDIALLNAIRLLTFEWQHGFFVESRLERYFLRFHTLMNAVDVFYILGHVVVTIGILAFLYCRRPQQYAFVRNLMAVTTALALVSFYVYPTAPPRLLSTYGFVDPLQLHHLVGAGGADPGSFTFNPYAAMPSLHVAYALVAACGLWLATSRPAVRAAAVVYPALMAVAVVISGNHWILDVLGAVVTVTLAALVLGLVHVLARLVRSQPPLKRHLVLQRSSGGGNLL